MEEEKEKPTAAQTSHRLTSLNKPSGALSRSPDHHLIAGPAIILLPFHLRAAI